MPAADITSSHTNQIVTIWHKTVDLFLNKDLREVPNVPKIWTLPKDLDSPRFRNPIAVAPSPSDLNQPHRMWKLTCKNFGQLLSSTKPRLWMSSWAAPVWTCACLVVKWTVRTNHRPRCVGGASIHHFPRHVARAKPRNSSLYFRYIYLRLSPLIPSLVPNKWI